MLSGFTRRDGVIEDTQNVGLLHDDQIFASKLDFASRPFAKQHAVTGFDVERMQFASVIAPAWADREDLSLDRLFLRRVGNEDAAGGFVPGIDEKGRGANFDGGIL